MSSVTSTIDRCVLKTGISMTLHPTPRPVAMLMDIFLDCSKRGNIVMEPFIGSGTAVLAAEKTGRRCYGIDMEPRYIDLAIRRWENLTGKQAVRQN